MTLTDHFSESEMLVSAKFPHLLKGVVLTVEQKNRGFLLATLVLEPIRDRFGVIRVESWFRPEALNTALGGVPNSQHMLGEAADILCPFAPSMGLVYRFVLDELKWPGEAILYKKRGHLHVALPRYGLVADHKIVET